MFSQKLPDNSNCVFRRIIMQTCISRPYCRLGILFKDFDITSETITIERVRHDLRIYGN